MNLLSPVTEIKGIGEKTAALFQRMGIHTVEELLSYYPRTYERFEEPVTFANLEEGIQQAVYGDIKKQLEVKKARGLTFATTTLVEFGTSLQLSWYNMPYLRNTLKPGSNYIFRGLVQRRRGRLVMDHPQLYKPEE